MTMMPADLRARLAADYQPVRALPSPWLRTMWVLPLAIVVAAAAPTVFNVRADISRLGFAGVWGLSLLQFAAGLIVIAAALRESVPGRGWSRPAVALWLTLPVAAVIAVTFASWAISPVSLRREFWMVVSGVCFGGSASTALPLVALASILAGRAYPTRPAVTGALLGAGAGLIADAGWRSFCHFSDPSHVLSSHLAAVVMSAVIGSLASIRLGTRAR